MRLNTADLKKVTIRDSFWDKYTKLVTEEVIPYQWKVLNDELEDVEPSHAIRNFRIAAGLEEGDFYGFVFQDSDLAKWLEAVAYSLACKPDAALEERTDQVIDLVRQAQQENGYLDTYFFIRDPGHEFTNLREGHELYCAGHLIEAGVAYYHATGKRALLDICRRMADHIVEEFHTERLERGIPGHEEIELALVKLYEVTGKEEYLNMALEFLDRRGQKPHFFFEEMKKKEWKQVFYDQTGEGYHLDYSQTDEPVRRQKTARGHAVRAVYLYCAMADVAYYKKDEELLKACETLYENIVQRQMYITGGIGSSGWLERFTVDYDLPNAMNYAESCASIGLALFCRRMAQITHDARYMDTAETALYNTVLAGIAMDGQSFFYVNPLAVWPHACVEGTSRGHVKPVRQKWFSCACCPPNIARTLASLGEYAYFTDEEGLWVNFFLSGEMKVKIGGADFVVCTETAFPFGNVWTMELREDSLRKDGLSEDRRCDNRLLSGDRRCDNRLLSEDRLAGRELQDRELQDRELQGRELQGIELQGGECADQEMVDESTEKGSEAHIGKIRIRIPEYVSGYQITLNGSFVQAIPEKGYAKLSGSFRNGDKIRLEFDMPAEFLYAHPMVRADAGRIALKKGPLVYCLEEMDNGSNLEQLLVDTAAGIEEIYDPDQLGGILKLKAKGQRSRLVREDEDQLYTKYSKGHMEYEPVELTYVPYAYWGNRTPGEMIVWVRQKM